MSIALLLAGLVSQAIGMVELAGPVVIHTVQPVAPMSILFAVVAFAFALSVRGAVADAGPGPARRRRSPAMPSVFTAGPAMSRMPKAVLLAMLGAVVGVCAFWSACIYSEISGANAAKAKYLSLARGPKVEMCGAVVPGLGAPLSQAGAGGGGDDHSVCYGPFVLILRAGSTDFLVRPDWQPGRDTIAVRESPQMVLYFSGPPRTWPG